MMGKMGWLEMMGNKYLNMWDLLVVNFGPSGWLHGSDRKNIPAGIPRRHPEVFGEEISCIKCCFLGPEAPLPKIYWKEIFQ